MEKQMYSSILKSSESDITELLKVAMNSSYNLAIEEAISKLPTFKLYDKPQVIKELIKLKKIHSVIKKP